MLAEPVIEAIGQSIGDVDIDSTTRVGGGSINRCYKLTTFDRQDFFLKVNRSSQLQMFEAESDGLSTLKKSAAVRVPGIIASGLAGDSAFLLLEFLHLGEKTPAADARMGELLACQHKRQGTVFGWHRDNTVGSTPQINTETSDWLRFFREHRLGFQLELAMQNGYGDLRVSGERLLGRLSILFSDHRPEPSLLHGDLWGGNWSATVDGEPAIFDPAVYYGDREADIAMTQLFGGFGPEFYTAYNRTWPLDGGFKYRRDIYNLYHVLNHLNIFGGGYLRQATALINSLNTLAG